ncbi:hypothetical protein OIU85_016174, partial [Salix viminalis]
THTLNFARIASESLILDPQSFEDDEFDLMEELDFDQEDFWTSNDSISNISPDYLVERERYSNAAERLETENRELERAHATMESACFVVTALAVALSCFLHDEALLRSAIFSAAERQTKLGFLAAGDARI